MMFTSNQCFLGLVLLRHVSVAMSLSRGVGDGAASSPTTGVATDLPRRRKITNRARRSADNDHHRDLGIDSHTTAISHAIQTMEKINDVFPTTRGHAGGGGGGGGPGEDAMFLEMFPDARNGNDTGKGKGKGGSKAPKASKAPSASKAPKASKAPTVSKAPKACGGKGSSRSGTKVSIYMMLKCVCVCVCVCCADGESFVHYSHTCSHIICTPIYQHATDSQGDIIVFER